jgi:hypothetical protein
VGRMIRLAVLIASITLSAATCSSTSDSAGPGAGATRTLLTDDPFPYYRVARVDLFIVSVSASIAPDTAGSANGFVTLATPNRSVNVLALQNGMTDELGTADLRSGAITAVRMVIDTDRSSITLKNGAVLRGNTQPGIAWQSSAGRPVLNAINFEQMQVPDTGATVVVVVDVGKMFMPSQYLDSASTDSGFVFLPELRAADVGRTGSIIGTVRAHTSAGPAVEDASLRLYLGDPATPENTWTTLGTAKSDGNGTFRFAFVTRSAVWAGMPVHARDTYIVAVDPPVGSGLGRKLVANLSVTAGGETPTGTVVLP